MTISLVVVVSMCFMTTYIILLSIIRQEMYYVYENVSRVYNLKRNTVMKNFLTEIRTFIKQLQGSSDMVTPYLPSDPERDFVVPDKKHEVLKALDKLSTLYSRNAPKVQEAGGISKLTLLQDAMRFGVAKVDFALIERGDDFGEMIDKFHGEYYERARDLDKCGHSWVLINYYLEEYSIEITRKDSSRFDKQRPDFSSTIEFKDAVKHRLCDSYGKLLVTKAQYTRFAVVKYDITQNYQEKWRRFDNIFVDEKGVVVPFKQFLQSSRDQGFEKMKEKAELEFQELEPKAKTQSPK